MTRSVRSIVLAGAVVLLVVAGCSVSTNDEPVAVRGPFDGIVQSTTTSSSTSTPTGGTRTVDVFFVESTDGTTELVPVDREVEADAGVTRVLQHLFGDPPTERGLRNDMPPAAVLVGATLVPQTSRVVVDTQGLFGQSGVQNPQLRNALGQIVCTATALAGIEEVLFENEGRPVSASIENSESVDRAVDCSDYDELS